MTLPELQEQIRAGKLKPFYVFTGDEKTVMNIYIDKITGGNHSVQYDFNLSKTLFKRVGWIVIRTTEPAPNIMYDKVIIVSDNPQPYHSDNTIKFEPMHEDIIIKRLTASGISLLDARRICKSCNNNYDMIEQIMHKYKYARPYQSAIIDELEYTADNAIDLFIKNITTMNTTCLALIPQVNIFQVLPRLYDIICHAIQVKSCTDLANITELTGMTQHQVDYIKSNYSRYKIDKLIDIRRELAAYDQGIKTGTRNESTCLIHIIGLYR